MNKYGKITGKDKITFQRMLPGPISRVWQYLVDSEKRGKWLAKGPMDLRVDGKLELNFKHAELNAPKGEVPEKWKQYENGSTTKGVITKLDEPNVLAFEWIDGDEASHVEIELEERGQEVLLTLTHTKLPTVDHLLGVAGGWHTHLDILVNTLTDQKSEPFWDKHLRLEREYRDNL